MGTVMGRKYTGLVTYGVLTFCGVALIYYTFWEEDLPIWCRYYDRELNSGKSGQEHDGVILMREREKASYDRLMRYILHPPAQCRTLVTMGGKRARNRKVDGDKVICLEPGPGIPEGCIVYSFGIAHEWSFDEAIHAKFGCQVFAFDPSMGFDDHMHSKGIWFYNLGLGETDGVIQVERQAWKMKTFDSILKQLGHRNKTIDVLKIDIEGAEYVVLEDMLNKGMLKHVNHLCLEIHLPDNPHWKRVHKLLMRIEEEGGLRLFSTRNNSLMPLMRVPGFYARYEQHFFEMAWFRH